MSLRLTLWGAALIVPLVLTGCGDTSQNSAPQDGGSYQAAAAPSLPPVTPIDTGDDPLAGTDALAAGGGDSDPLASDGDSLGDASPLDETAPHADNDPMLGRAMPTEHSHWLNVEMHDARVTVRLNGIQIGAPTSTGTTDITMRLHKGPNFLSLTYTPRSNRSWAGVTVNEGEHRPALAPLVSFRQAPVGDTLSLNPDASPAPLTKTFTFLAR